MHMVEWCKLLAVSLSYSYAGGTEVGSVIGYMCTLNCIYFTYLCTRFVFCQGLKAIKFYIFCQKLNSCFAVATSGE